MINKSLNKSIEYQESLVQEMIEYQESLIQEMIKLYSDDFEKRYIKRILGKNWKIGSFSYGEFIIRDGKNIEIIMYDSDGNLEINILDLFTGSPISFKDGSFIDEMKIIIKLYENRYDIQEFLCKFIKTIEPMFESVRILKTALK